MRTRFRRAGEPQQGVVGRLLRGVLRFYDPGLGGGPRYDFDMSKSSHSSGSQPPMRLGLAMLPPLAIAALLIVQIMNGFQGFDREAMGTGATFLGLPGYVLGWGSVALLIPFLVWTYLEWRGRQPSGLFLTILGACTLGIAVAGLSAVFGDAAAGGQVGEELANMLENRLTTVPAFLVLLLMALPAVVLATTPLHAPRPTSTQTSPSTFAVATHEPLPGAAPRALRSSSSSTSSKSVVARIRNAFRRNKSSGGNDGIDATSRDQGRHHPDPDIRYVDEDRAPHDAKPVDASLGGAHHDEAQFEETRREATETPQDFPRVPSSPASQTPMYDADEPIEVVVDGNAFDEPEYVVPPKDGVRVVERASTSASAANDPHESLPTLSDVMRGDSTPVHISSSPRGHDTHTLEPWARIETDDDDAPIHVGADGKPVKVTPAELHPGTVFPASDSRSPYLRSAQSPEIAHTTTQEDISVAVRAHSESHPTAERQGRIEARELVEREAARVGSQLVHSQLEAAAEGRDAGSIDTDKSDDPHGALSVKSAAIPQRLGVGRNRRGTAASTSGELPGRAAILDALRGLPTLRAAERQGAGPQSSSSQTGSVRASVRESLDQVSARSRYKAKLEASGIFDASSDAKTNRAPATNRRQTTEIDVKPSTDVAPSRSTKSKRGGKKTTSSTSKRSSSKAASTGNTSTKKRTASKKAASKRTSTRKASGTSTRSRSKAVSSKAASTKTTAKQSTKKSSAAASSRKTSSRKSPRNVGKPAARTKSKKASKYSQLEQHILDKGGRTLRGAVDVAVNKGAATPILLTRRLQIPIDRAQELVEEMVTLGVLGPAGTRGSFPTLLSERDWASIRG